MPSTARHGCSTDGAAALLLGQRTVHPYVHVDRRRATDRRATDGRATLVVRLGAAMREDDANTPGPRGGATGSPLEAALASLADADRLLVTLGAWDGFTVAEAGRVLGLKASTARSRCMRARRALAEHLDAMDRQAIHR